MKFSVLASTLFSSLVATASAGPLERRYTETPQLFDLTVNGLENQSVIWNNVMFANGSAYVGNIKYRIESEPLLMTGGSSQYARTFTSFHASPTGWRTFYVMVNETAPVAFTTPHSAYIPAGAQYNGFGTVDGKFQLDVGKGPVEKWMACKIPETTVSNTYQLYWAGKPGQLQTRECYPVTLKVGEATECRYPQSS